jgi:hypothetical protein
VLTKSYLVYKGENLSAKLWWDGHAEIGSLLVPRVAIEACLSVPPGGSWSTVEKHLHDVATSSDVGSAIFGMALSKLAQSKTTKIIADALTKIQLADITLDTIKIAKDEVVTNLRAFNVNAHDVVGIYVVKVHYRSVELDFTVHSAMDEFLAKLSGITRGIAVDKGVLPPLLCENQLVPKNRALPTITVDAAVVADSKRARQTAENLAQGREADSGAAMIAIFKQKHSILWGLDKSWRLEFTFFESHNGEHGARRLRSLIVECLPSDQLQISPTASLALLNELGRSKLLSFCGLGLTSVFTNVLEWVEHIRDHRVPSFQSETSEFIALVKTRMASFLSHSPPAGSAGGTIMYGADAARALHLQMKVLVAAKSEEVTLQKLTPLQVFSWLLPIASQKDVKAWIDIELAKGSVAAVGRATRGRGRGRGGATAVRGESAVSKVAGLFRN